MRFKISKMDITPVWSPRSKNITPKSYNIYFIFRLQTSYEDCHICPLRYQCLTEINREKDCLLSSIAITADYINGKLQPLEISSIDTPVPTKWLISQIKKKAEVEAERIVSTFYPMLYKGVRHEEDE